MKCEWDALLGLLPTQIQNMTEKTYSPTVQELRLRAGQDFRIICADKTIVLPYRITASDLQYCINAATRYSPWTASTVQSGYITVRGGHRIGLCGEFTEGSSAISKYTSLCIRVAKDYPDIAKGAAKISGSLLILGRPGSGKTTLLRDLIRQKSNVSRNSIAVVDERRELFPVTYDGYSFPVGANTDILSGVSKAAGIEMAIRNLGADTVAFDEITAKRDCDAMLSAAWCGVDILATAHAASVEDLCNRSIYKPIIDSHLFDTVVVLCEDKSWRTERIFQ